jgi:hypothetical protein
MNVLKLCSLLPLLASLTTSSTAFCGDNVLAIEIPEDSHFLSVEDLNLKNASDSYVEAYIQGVLDARYPKSGVSVVVRNGEILLTKLPENQEDSNEIVQFVKAMTKRSVKETKPVVTLTNQQNGSERPSWYGIWLPQSTVLFPTQVANPRQICFSVGGRYHDKVGGQVASEVTIGAQFPIYRWANVRGGDLQLELEAAVFAVFDMRDPKFSMINADYYAGVPISYAKGNWAFRLRPYHVSSHVGDEYMVNHRHMHRKNKSFEAMDFSADYSFTKQLRVYGGVGAIVAADQEMPMKRAYIEYGFEARGPRSDFSQLYGQPFFAVHMQNWQVTNFRQDNTYALGYEWGKINGIGRKIRLFFEYHDGLSPEGQFCHRRTKYLGIRIAYGF